MIDIEYLNERATKIKSTLKKLKQIIDFGEEIFIKTPMYPDRTKYYLMLLYDELEKVACHLLKIKENCLQKLTEEQLFSAKLTRTFLDLIHLREKLFQENFSYSDKELYSFTKELYTTLDNLFLKELATVVKELKEKEPKFAININIKKFNQYLNAINSSLHKLKTFQNYKEEEFKNSSYAIDRTRYYLVMIIDSINWICRHIVRQANLKLSSNCLQTLAENNFISEETGKKLQEIVSLKDILADPTKDIDTAKLYEILISIKDYSTQFLKEVIKKIKGENL